MAFHPIVQPGNQYPNVRSLPIYSGGTSFVAGEFVKWDTVNFGVDRCGTNPTAILGIATCGSANAAIYPLSRIPVIVLEPDDVICMDIINSGAAYNPSDILLFNTYGITRDATGHWLLDFAKSGANQVLTVVDYRPARVNATAASLQPGQNFTYAKFLASVLQGDSIVS